MQFFYILEIKNPPFLLHTDSIEILLNTIHCFDYQWSLCGDLKVIGILMALQGFYKTLLFFMFVVQLRHCTAL